MRNKKSKDQIIIENRLYLGLSNMISDFKLGRLTEEDIYNYFRLFLDDANIDSQITVNVLENDCFGDLGKNEARNIKVHEGW